MIRLASGFISQLLQSPESGMGYQLVDVEQTDGLRKSGVAFNAELILFDEESRGPLLRFRYETLVKAAQSSAGRIKSVRVRPKPTRQVSAVREKPAGAPKAPTEANDAPVESTAAGEVFKRFSAFANDRRVQPDGSLLPDTYATTEADAKNVGTGSEATRRYALPHPDPASYVLTSRPHAQTSIKRGVVAPANGQPGGGVEVIFTAGTQPNTTTGPMKIPD